LHAAEEHYGQYDGGLTVQPGHPGQPESYQDGEGDAGQDRQD